MKRIIVITVSLSDDSPAYTLEKELNDNFEKGYFLVGGLAVTEYSLIQIMQLKKDIKAEAPKRKEGIDYGIDYGISYGEKPE